MKQDKKKHNCECHKKFGEIVKCYLGCIKCSGVPQDKKKIECKCAEELLDCLNCANNDHDIEHCNVTTVMKKSEELNKEWVGKGIKPQENSEWEKRFNKQFLVQGSDCTWLQWPDPDEVKEFISQERKLERERVIEEVEKIDQELEDMFVKNGSADEFLQSIGVYRSNFMHKLKLKEEEK